MNRTRIAAVTALLLTLAMPRTLAAALELSAEALEDKLRGGLLGQVLGNLNGLPHEMKYIREPGNVQTYTPALPEGARTDDDTDIEWVYLMEMARTGELFLPPARIVQLWKTHINRHIWCANLYARKLFDLGLEPPLTGQLAINPWANFNISGSFLCESFALCAPGLPQSAGRLALHYTQVAIDGEPAQLTQFVAALIATAFVESDLNRVLDAGLAAVDARSVIRALAADVRRWHREHPDDWRATRRLIRDQYTRYDGHEMRDRNGVELNTAATIAALLYGQGDFVETLKLAFNFGWDADNNAATAGTVLGVIRGKRWFDAQGWNIQDVYRNTTRDGMPKDETLTRFGDRMLTVAARLLESRRAQRANRNGQTFWRIPLEKPANVVPLKDPAEAHAEVRTKLRSQIEQQLGDSGPTAARAAYLAICLGEAPRLRQQRPEDWARALAALQASGIIEPLFTAPKPDGPRFQDQAREAGLLRPPAKKP